MTDYQDRDFVATARAVRRLDEHALIAPKDIVVIDGQQWSGQEIVDAVVFHLRERVTMSRGQGSQTAAYALKETTKRDVSVLLYAFGASYLTVETWSRKIAGKVRSGYHAGR